MIELLAIENGSANTTANIIAAGAAVSALITSVALLIPTLRQVKSVHKIVNQDHTDDMNFQRALIRALEAHGIPVPIDQSLPPVPDHDPTPEDPGD